MAGEKATSDTKQASHKEGDFEAEDPKREGLTYLC
jgi:hypothetical protein